MRDTGQSPLVSPTIRLLAVIVIYQQKACESESFNTLQFSLANVQSAHAEISVLVYDNTPGGQNPGVLPSNVHYKADPENGGLAKAYNFALEMAKAEGIDWVLTLDQDTALMPDFISKMCHTLAFVEPMNSVGAVIPWISEGERIISPKIFIKRWGLFRKLPDGFIGIPSGEASAVNSGAVLRVSALTAIGGYDPSFFLHSSDVVLFHRLHLNGFKTFIAGDARAQHEMSVFDLKKRSTPSRYEENLRAEEAFYDQYLGWAGNVVLLLRIFQRLSFRLWRTGATLPYFKLTVQSLGRRLLYSRQRRIDLWRKWVTDQKPGVTALSQY